MGRSSVRSPCAGSLHPHWGTRGARSGVLAPGDPQLQPAQGELPLLLPAAGEAAGRGTSGSPEKQLTSRNSPRLLFLKNSRDL